MSCCEDREIASGARAHECREFNRYFAGFQNESAEVGLWGSCHGQHRSVASLGQQHRASSAVQDHLPKAAAIYLPGCSIGQRQQRRAHGAEAVLVGTGCHQGGHRDAVSRDDGGSLHFGQRGMQGAQEAAYLDGALVMVGCVRHDDVPLKSDN